MFQVPPARFVELTIPVPWVFDTVNSHPIRRRLREWLGEDGLSSRTQTRSGVELLFERVRSQALSPGIERHELEICRSR